MVCGNYFTDDFSVSGNAGARYAAKVQSNSYAEKKAGAYGLMA